MFNSSNYIVPNAIAVYDGGLDYDHQGMESRYHTILMDTNNDGILSDDEKLEARKVLHKEAVRLGGKEISLMSDCVDTSGNDGVLASNDRVIFLNQGTVIEVMNSPFEFGMLHYLVDNGVIIPNLTTLESGILNQAFARASDELKHTTAGAIGGVSALVFVFVKNALRHLTYTKPTLANKYHIATILTVLNYAQSMGWVEIEGDNKAKGLHDMAKKISKELQA